MTKSIASVCLLSMGMSVAPIPTAAQAPSVTGSAAVADTIARLFGGIAEATRALDLDRLLAYYEESDALTYVAQGKITRSYSAFRDLVRTQLGGLSGAELTFLDTYVDVLSKDAAVATATYNLTARLPDGGSLRTTGTYMCIYVRHEDGWRVRYSAHTFPARQG